MGRTSFFLTGKSDSEPIEDNLISEVIVGQFNISGEEIEEFISGTKTDRVKEIAKALQELDFETYIDKFDMSAFRQNDIYPDIWEYEEEADEIEDALRTSFESLKKFYEKMASRPFQFFRECGHTSGHFVLKSERRTRDGDFHIRAVFLIKSRALILLYLHLNCINLVLLLTSNVIRLLFPHNNNLRFENFSIPCNDCAFLSAFSVNELRSMSSTPSESIQPSPSVSNVYLRYCLNTSSGKLVSFNSTIFSAITIANPFFS